MINYKKLNDYLLDQNEFISAPNQLDIDIYGPCFKWVWHPCFTLSRFGLLHSIRYFDKILRYICHFNTYYFVYSKRISLKATFELRQKKKMHLFHWENLFTIIQINSKSALLQAHWRNFLIKNILFPECISND